jgi:hypothetical protein
MRDIISPLERTRRACIAAVRWPYTSATLLTAVCTRKQRVSRALRRCMPEANALTRAITATILIARQLDRLPGGATLNPSGQSRVTR